MKKVIMVAAGCMVMVATSAAWAADVTVAGLNAPNGALVVDADTTVLTNGFNATLPSALADEATLWFAADTNVIADENGGVTEWRDVREAANAETRLYKAALAYLPEEGEDGYEFRSELPVLVTTNKLFRPGAKVVDFGSYGSGRWLYFAAPGSTDRLRVNIGSFFTVIGFDSTCGHILGDVAALATGASGVMYFHKGLGAQTGGNIATGTEANSTMHLGETRLNGTRIDPRNVASTPSSSFRRTGRTARRAEPPSPPRSSTTATSSRRTAARWCGRAAARWRSSSRSRACSPTRNGARWRPTSRPSTSACLWRDASRWRTARRLRRALTA